MKLQLSVFLNASSDEHVGIWDYSFDGKNLIKPMGNEEETM